MMNRYLLILIIGFIGISFLVSCNTNNKPLIQNEIDERCKWEHGLCKNICNSPNYYFDKESGYCYKYLDQSDYKGCCTPPPFQTLEECQKICEKRIT